MASLCDHSDKLGNFDWIVDYEQLRPYVQPEGPNPDGRPRSALVIGCGTSKVSERLVGEGFDLVVSIDNDASRYNLLI